MVAMNWQMWDEGMMLNEGMFAGEHGWVLKPLGYRSHDAATNQADAIQHKTLDLKVTIFGGQHVPLPDDEDNVKGFYPFIKCELHVEKQEERTGEPIEGGGRAKEGEHKRRTEYKKGDHPDFGPEGVSLEFMGISKVVEELSFIRYVTQLLALSFSVSLLDPHVSYTATKDPRTRKLHEQSLRNGPRIGLR